LRYKTVIAWIQSYQLQDEKAKSPLHALEPHFALTVPNEFAAQDDFAGASGMPKAT
jgi:hypothetical protein